MAEARLHSCERCGAGLRSRRDRRQRQARRDRDGQSRDREFLFGRRNRAQAQAYQRRRIQIAAGPFAHARQRSPAPRRRQHAHSKPFWLARPAHDRRRAFGSLGRSGPRRKPDGEIPMMKVLTAIVAPPHMSASGAARAAEKLSMALSAYASVTVASMLPKQHPESPVIHHEVRTNLPWGLPWSWLPKRYRTLFYRSDIGDIIRRGGYDLVHLHNPMPALEMARVAAACRESGTPYVVSTHGFNEVANGLRVYGFGPLRRWVWRNLVYRPVAWVVRGAAAVLLLSPADAEIIRAMGARDAEIYTIPNGVELAKEADPVLDAATLKKFGLDGGQSGQPTTPLTCMFLANHTPNKGLTVLMHAFQSLELPFLLIIGGEQRPGIDYDGFVRSLKKGQRAIVTGRLEDHEIPA